MGFLTIIKNIPLFCEFLREFASFWEAFKLKRLASLLYDVKKIFDDFENQSKKKRIDSTFEAIELILAYKTEYPQDFEDLCRAIKIFCQKRKDDSSIDEDILSLME